MVPPHVPSAKILRAAERALDGEGGGAVEIRRISGEHEGVRLRYWSSRSMAVAAYFEDVDAIVCGARWGGLDKYPRVAALVSALADRYAAGRKPPGGWFVPGLALRAAWDSGALPAPTGPAAKYLNWLGACPWEVVAGVVTPSAVHLGVVEREIGGEELDALMKLPKALEPDKSRASSMEWEVIPLSRLRWSAALGWGDAEVDFQSAEFAVALDEGHPLVFAAEGVGVWRDDGGIAVFTRNSAWDDVVVFPSEEPVRGLHPVALDDVEAELSGAAGVGGLFPVNASPFLEAVGERLDSGDESGGAKVAIYGCGEWRAMVVGVGQLKGRVRSWMSVTIPYSSDEALIRGMVRLEALRSGAWAGGPTSKWLVVPPSAWYDGGTIHVRLSGGEMIVDGAARDVTIDLAGAETHVGERALSALGGVFGEVRLAREVVG